MGEKLVVFMHTDELKVGNLYQLMPFTKVQII